MKVKANFNYNDLKLNKVIYKGEVIEVDEERAKELTNKQWQGTPFCEIVEEEKEAKEEVQEEKPKIEKATKKQPKKEKAVKAQ